MRLIDREERETMRVRQAADLLMALRESRERTTGNQEMMRFCYGTTYRVRGGYGLAGDQYLVTADGTPLGAPTDYRSAVAAFRALTA
jgi:hypothetical protein